MDLKCKIFCCAGQCAEAMTGSGARSSLICDAWLLCAAILIVCVVISVNNLVSSEYCINSLMCAKDTQLFALFSLPQVFFNYKSLRLPRLYYSMLGMGRSR